jgi:hypothetical protein
VREGIQLDELHLQPLGPGEALSESALVEKRIPLPGQVLFVAALYQNAQDPPLPESGKVIGVPGGRGRFGILLSGTDARRQQKGQEH